MVTPTNGTATFVGVNTKQVKQVDFYISDVVGANCTFSRTGKAGTGNNAWIRFDEPVIMTDLSIASGPTVMVGLIPLSNDAIVNDGAFRIANFLNSITTRPVLNIGFQAGKNITLQQF